MEELWATTQEFGYMCLWSWWPLHSFISVRSWFSPVAKLSTENFIKTAETPYRRLSCVRDKQGKKHRCHSGNTYGHIFHRPYSFGLTGLLNQTYDYRFNPSQEKQS